jgi:hypothetical protein
VSLERGPLSLVRITEELLEWKSSGSGLENREHCGGDPLRWPRDILYQQKLALRRQAAVGIIRLWTKATEFVLFGFFSVDALQPLILFGTKTVSCNHIS